LKPGYFRMKPIRTLSIFLFVIAPTISWAQEWLWANNIYLDTELQVFFEDVAVDSQDNNYVIGDYEMYPGEKDFGFVRKYSAAGELIWSTKVEPVEETVVRFGGIDLKSNGNSIIVGTIGGETTFGETVLDASGGNVFVAELDKISGEFNWARSIKGGGQWDAGRDVSVDNLDNIIVSNGNFITKMNPVGDLIWEINPGFTRGYVPFIGVDSEGSIYVSGVFSRSISFPDVNYDPVASDDIVVVKYDNDGEYVWSRHFGGPERDFVNEVVIDDFGNLALIGLAGDILTLESPIMTTGQGAIIARISSDGQIISTDLLGGEFAASGWDLYPTVAGDLYISVTIAGSYFNYRGDSIALDGMNFVDHSFLFRLNEAGDLSWSYKFKESYSQEIGEYYAPFVNHLAVNQESNLFTSIRYLESANLGDTILISPAIDGTGVGLINPETGDFVVHESEPPYCESDSVKLTANIELTGGTNFLWSTGETTPSIYVSESGNYSVKAFNDASTIVRNSDIIPIEFLPLPFVIIVAESNVLCPGNQQVLDAGPGFNNYLWSTGETTQTIAVSETAGYSVIVTNNGCSTSDTIDIEVAEPYDESICLVSIEDGRNQVVWQKTKDKRTVSYNIYKQGSQSDVYDLIGNVPFNSESIFIDENSEPEVKSDFYRIATVDSCGNESAQSPFHQTIHLSQSAGNEGEINLSWNKYQGFDYNTFNVYRGSNLDNMKLIAEIAGNIFAFTDQTPPSGNLYYQIGVASPDPCDTELSGGRVSSLFQEARSNVTSRTVTALDDIVNGFYHIYPNPSNGVLKIRFDDVSRNYALEVMDPLGRIIKSYQGKISGEYSITFPTANSGMYILSISNYQLGDKIMKLIVQ